MSRPFSASRLRRSASFRRLTGVGVAELAPKVIGAGKSVVDLWQSAGGIIADAEKTGTVNADAAMRLKAMGDAQLVALDRKADDARAG